MSGVREQKDIIQSDITTLYHEDPLALSFATSLLTKSVSFAEQLINSFMGELFCELKKYQGPRMKKFRILSQQLCAIFKVVEGSEERNSKN